jgi:bifunctional non-homologous end joining protein LigD
LKSWAVPKGPSLNPAEKRLAVHVEDHPLEYADFEGVIPPKQYGAGTVMVWDRGRWKAEGNPFVAYRKGHLKFSLDGEKLHGGWSLVRMGHGRHDNGRNWLLIKERDEATRTNRNAEVTNVLTRSVKSGMDLDEIAEAKTDVWHSNRSADWNEKQSLLRLPHARRPDKDSPGTVSSKLKATSELFPDWIRPQLATLVETIPKGDEWVHELKYDGYRMLCRIERGEAQLYSRNGLEWTHKLGALAAAVSKLPVTEAWLDGEVVVLMPDGSMSFQALQRFFDGMSDGQLVYYLFDLLYLDGEDLRQQSLLERKGRLAFVLEGEPDESILRYSVHVVGHGETIFNEACRRDMEGLISKRSEGTYVSGRHRNWLKVKCRRRQEFIIVGFTDPAGARHGFGALLLGVHEESGILKYVGRVGTGFSEDSLTRLHHQLQKLVRSKSPVINPPSGYDAKGVHWVHPTLVAEVHFAEWTREGLLRHAAFLGLRPDKSPRQVVREDARSKPAPAQPAGASSPSRGRTRFATKALANLERSHNTKIAGVTLTHPDRVLFPSIQVTKLELARYYEHIAEWILPHLKNRPLTLVRCPEGHEAGCFYQKHVTEQVAAEVDRIEVQQEDGSACYMMANSLSAVISLVQMGVLEFHTWGARAQRLDRPDRMILDLDPDPDLSWKRVIEGAQLTKTLLESLGLVSFVKTTGGKGLHIVIPLQRTKGWEEVKSFSKRVAEHLAYVVPSLFTANMAKRSRHGKIYVDYLRNAHGATAVASYSTRARAGAPVSVPLTWDELSRESSPHRFTIRNLQERLQQLHQDLWIDYPKVKQSISAHMLRLKPDVGRGKI